MTFREYASTWFEEGAVRRGWKPSTVGQYRSVERRLVEHFGSYPLGAVRPRHIAAYVAEGGSTLGPSVGRDLALLHAIFKTALREELVEANPAAGAEYPAQPKRRWRILEPVDVSRTYKAFTDDQARTNLLVLTGTCRSELIALRWRDVDLVESILRIRDSKSEDGVRSIAISVTLAEELWQHRRRSHYQGADEFVFCTRSAEPLTPRSASSRRWTRRSRQRESMAMSVRSTTCGTRRSRTMQLPEPTPSP
jgi:integrase